jgi:hypothetical protein
MAQVVALGSQGRYYVAFEDGTMEFEGGGHSDFQEVVGSERVAVVAFGEHPTSYFTMLISGEFHWCVAVKRERDGQVESTVMVPTRKALRRESIPARARLTSDVTTSKSRPKQPAPFPPAYVTPVDAKSQLEPAHWLQSSCVCV